VSKELPEILSDEEFARKLQEREAAAHALSTTHDQWKNNSARNPVRQPSDGLPESTIEQHFPRIAQKLVLVWPSEACAAYLTSLIVNEREARQGFPPEVLDDLLMLHSMNDMILRGLQPRSAVRSTTDKPPPHF
jgi:hypothetical protein